MIAVQGQSRRIQQMLRGRMVPLRDSLHWLLTDQTTDAVLRRGFAILALVTAVTAYFSETYFFPDEHYQILEFVSHKLGITSATELTWEYHARLRPWLQPFLYYLIAKPLIAAGVRDLFTVTFVLRMATGAVSLFALWAFAKLIIHDLQRPDEKRAYARLLPFMGFLPYLFVRTSSETLAAAFFTLGLVYAVQAVRAGSLRRMAAAGMFCGLAFECRYQSGLLSLGLLLWLTFMAKARRIVIATFAAGALGAVAIGVLIDRWGYGVWSFPAWTYLDVNVIQGVSSSVFGASPFYAYLYLPLGTVFAPITAVLVVALIVTCLRNPKHYVTWATVPFVLAHCFLAHKEERFLFPLAILATAYPVLAFAPGRPFPVFERLWAYRRSIPARAIGWSAVVVMVVLAFVPLGIRPHVKMAKFLYRNFAAGPVVYSFDEEPFRTYPMYRRPGHRAVKLQSAAELDRLLVKGPVYLFSETPTLPAEAARKGMRATLLFSEMPWAERFGSAGTRLICAVADLKRTTPISPPRFALMSLFRLERDVAYTDDVQPPPCTPDWTAPRK